MTSFNLLLNYNVLDNILMIKFSEEGNLSDRSGGKSFVHGIDSDSFQGDCFFGSQVNSSADDTVGTFTNGIELVIVGEFAFTEAIIVIGQIVVVHGWIKVRNHEMFGI